jgi:hypothetical protein
MRIFFMTNAATHHLSFSTDMLHRGFWLYVWKITTSDGSHVHYVGRTGDSSSLKAQSPFSRASGHWGPNKHANAIRRNLARHNIDFSTCKWLDLITFGPLYPEADNESDHRERRDITHALERTLCEAMAAAGYPLLNTVPCRHRVDEDMWQIVREHFAEHFPKLGC